MIPCFIQHLFKMNLKKPDVFVKGLAASPGAACGKVYFTAEDCVEAVQRGEKVVLVRLETSPEDIEGIDAAEGMLRLKRRHDKSRCCCCPRNGYMLCSRLR